MNVWFWCELSIKVCWRNNMAVILRITEMMSFWRTTKETMLLAVVSHLTSYKQTLRGYWFCLLASPEMNACTWQSLVWHWIWYHVLARRFDRFGEILWRSWTISARNSLAFGREVWPVVWAATVGLVRHGLGSLLCHVFACEPGQSCVAWAFVPLL